MVIEWIVSSLIGLVQGVLTAILPTTAAPLTTVTGFIHAYTWFNTWLPVYETLDATRTAIEVALIVGGIYRGLWFLRQVPVLGLGGHD